MTDATQSPTGVPPLNIPRLSTATPQSDAVFSPQPRRTLQLFGGLQLGEAFPGSNSPLQLQRSYSPQQLQRMREDSRSPGVRSNQTYQDSESRMEAAGLLIDELTALKGQLRMARATLLCGHNENATRPSRWVSSPPNSATSTSAPSTGLSGPASGLQTPGMPRDVEKEAVAEQLQHMAERMEELENEVMEGSRALDLANVKLAEQLLLCSTLSAKLLWPEDNDPFRDAVADHAFHDAVADNTFGEDTSCTVDPFIDERRAKSSEALQEIPSDDPIESLSPSESGGDSEPVLPYVVSPGRELQAFSAMKKQAKALGAAEDSGVFSEEASKGSGSSRSKQRLGEQHQMSAYLASLAQNLKNLKPERSELDKYMSTEKESNSEFQSPVSIKAQRVREWSELDDSMGSTKAQRVRDLRLPGVYGRMTDYIFKQYIKNSKYRIFTSWHALAREGAWRDSIVGNRKGERALNLRQAVIENWGAKTRWCISVRRAHAKIETRAERNYVRKLLQLWAGLTGSIAATPRLIRAMKKRMILQKCTTTFIAWAAATSCQKLSVQECDWDCGFTGTPDEVAEHEKTCEAMLLATAWKRTTSLSLRPRVEDMPLEVDRARLMQWLPGDLVVTAGNQNLNGCATGALRRWLPKDTPACCPCDGEARSESGLSSFAFDSIQLESSKSKRVLETLCSFVKQQDEDLGVLITDSISNDSAQEAAEQIAAALVRTFASAMSRCSIRGSKAVVLSFLELLEELDDPWLAMFQSLKPKAMCGVGIRLTESYPLRVIEIWPRGPAGICGLIEVGDMLTKIDGHNVTNTNMALVRSITGPEGSTVSFDFVRKFQNGSKKSFSVNLIRAVLDVSIEASLHASEGHVNLVTSTPSAPSSHEKAALGFDVDSPGVPDQRQLVQPQFPSIVTWSSVPVSTKDTAAQNTSLFEAEERQREAKLDCENRLEHQSREHAKEIDALMQRHRETELELERSRKVIGHLLDQKTMSAENPLSVPQTSIEDMVVAKSTIADLELKLKDLESESARLKADRNDVTQLMSPAIGSPEDSNASQARQLPPGWKAYWSKSKNKPFYKKKGAPASFWQIPEEEWVVIDMSQGELSVNGADESIASASWGCEFGCGFKGVFDEVAEHEKTCTLRLVNELKTQVELLEREQAVLQAELDVSTAILKSKEKEVETLHECLKACDLDAIKEISDQNAALMQQLEAAQEKAMILQYEKEEFATREMTMAADLETAALEAGRLGSEVRLAAGQLVNDLVAVSLEAGRLGSEVRLAAEELAKLQPPAKSAPAASAPAEGVTAPGAVPPSDDLGAKLASRRQWEGGNGSAPAPSHAPAPAPEDDKAMNDIPIAISLRLDSDFDQAARDRAHFNELLTNDLCIALGVPTSSMKVLCLQRGSVIAEVVLMASEERMGDLFPEQDIRTPRHLAEELQGLVQSKDGKLSNLPMGQLIRHAEIHGPIAGSVVQVVARALEGALEARREENILINSFGSQTLKNEDANPRTTADVGTGSEKCPATPRQTQTEDSAKVAASTQTEDSANVDASTQDTTENSAKVAASTQTEDSANVDASTQATPARPVVAFAEVQTRPEECGIAVQASVKTSRRMVQATVEVAEQAVSTEETDPYLDRSVVREMFRGMKEKWTSRLARTHNGNGIKRAFALWRIEMEQKHALEQRLSWKMSYFVKYLTRPAFQKWTYEMITTYVIRERVESADHKREIQLVREILAIWSHASRSSILRQHKGEIVSSRVCMRLLSVGFARWCHLAYWGASLHGAKAHRARGQLRRRLHEWSRIVRKKKGKLTQVAHRDVVRRHSVRAKYLYQWECQATRIRRRNRCRVACEKMHRLVQLSGVFENWNICTKWSVRTRLEEGQTKPKLLVHVCPPKRRILAHALDMWTFGVSHKFRKACKTSKAERKFAAVNKKTSFGGWKFVFIKLRHARLEAITMMEFSRLCILEATFERFVVNRIRSQIFQRRLDTHETFTLSAALDRWLPAVHHALPEHEGALSDLQNPEQVEVTKTQVTNPASDYSEIRDSANGHAFTNVSATHHRHVLTPLPAAACPVEAAMQSLAGPDPEREKFLKPGRLKRWLDRSLSSDDQAYEHDEDNTFLEGKASEIFSRTESTDSSHDDDAAPAQTRSWGKSWKIKSLNDACASSATPAPRVSFSPEIRLRSVSPTAVRLRSASPQKSRATSPITRATQSPVSQQPSSPASSVLGEIGEIVTDLRLRPIPAVRSRTKFDSMSAESPGHQLDSNNTSGQDRNPPRHGRAADRASNGTPEPFLSPNLKELRRTLRSYD